MTKEENLKVEVWRKKVLSEVFQNLLPGKTFESVLDIGGGRSEIRDILKAKKYVNVGKPADEDYPSDPDVVIDLNSRSDLKKFRKFKDRSFDIVVLSQILEHLFFPEMVVRESERIAREHILVGLPNDLNILHRIRMLCGKTTMGYSKWGHHYLFNIKETETFCSTQFRRFRVVKKYFSRIAVMRKFPGLKFLSGIAPNLFANEVYFLLKRIK